jgi:hypothetical protein
MARIDHYEFGRIVVDGRQETRDLIILPDRVLRNWFRQDGHVRVLDDLTDVLDKLPPRLVVGTGADGRMRSDPDTVQQLQKRSVTVETLPTGQAVRRFGELDSARTAAAPPPHLLTRGVGGVDPVRELLPACARAAFGPPQAADGGSPHQRDTIGAEVR